jgi:bla regulator protein BlaR1
VVPVPPLPPADAIEAGTHAVVHLDSVTAPHIIAIHPDIRTDAHTKFLALSQIDEVTSMDLDSRGYAIYGPDGDHTVMMHGWFADSDKLHDEQAKHPGGAIVFRRDGKTWIIDNPGLVKQAQEAYSHVNELAKKQGELGGRQGELGAKQGELGALQGEIGAKQGEWGAMQGKLAEDFHFEMPKDFDKTVQEFTENETKFALDQEHMSDAQRAEWESRRKELKDRMDKAMQEFKAQQPQREAMEKQMREQSEQMRKQMEPMMKQMREMAAKQGELGRLQGELGRQQGLLGREQREASREADRKVQSLIDQAVRDGKAKPAN